MGINKVKYIEIIYNFLLKNKIKLKLIFFILLSIKYFNFIKKRKKIGIIGLEHSQNIGNNLLKYAIFIKLSELGFDPYIIGMKYKNHNISFIQKAVKLRVIEKTFKEINRNDYDILMVNSDQTWKHLSLFSYDMALLKFASNWTIPKFIYATSIGTEKWAINKKDIKIAKSLLKNFSGISVREISSIHLIKKYLGFNVLLVLDPTLLIDKNYYLNLIKNYKNHVNIDNNYIFIYTVSDSFKIKKYINKVKSKYKYKYKLYIINMGVPNQILKFIYGISNCKGVITDSYHGTLFSLIFNKPFISFIVNAHGNARFNSLKEVFNIGNRFFKEDSIPDLGLLESPLNLNLTQFNLLKKQSIKFLKKNLNIEY